MNYKTLLAKELSKNEKVKDIKEKLLSKEEGVTTAYKINFDYNGFPLAGLEVLDGAGLRFLNMRLIISYPKNKYEIEFVKDVVNNFNLSNIGLKAFYDFEGSEKEFDISYNLEDVFDENDLNPGLILDKKINMLVRGPRDIHKELDKE
ncbi:TPA: hypothetical protein QCH81_002225 [Enterobacter bugandensis]|uniref:hypothetical protein n=1 Tax=Enterobacter roggenkampii TaxID=1812935 RepID=UPI0021D319CA|nr:hypothetical protein [Enterobacter roggenkampii]MCU6164905.1 hypothetical protein [Enterobacter roggenkampii]HDR2401480.1 hypothetical protein [Enterobacter bugandensis]